MSTALRPLVIRGAIGPVSIEHPLSDGTHSVGRGAQATLKLADTSVSREHAEFRVSDSGIELRDLGSRNGSWVNGRRLEANDPVLLHAGDELRIGAIILKLIDPDRPNAQEMGTMAGSVVPRLSNDAVEASVRLSWEDLHSRMDVGVRRERDLFRVLSEAGALLVAQRPLNEIFEAALDLLERVVPARRILLLLNDGEGGAEVPMVRAARPASAAGQKIMLSRTLLSAVLEKRDALLVADARLDPNFRNQESIVLQDISSALAAPLFDNEKVIGLVYADSNDILQRFDQDMLRAFTMLANLVAVKISNTRLLEAEREKERMAQELATAARIQQSLLPSVLPEVPGFELFACQLPCFECAGDLYDAESRDGSLAITLGDVSGKGMGAAMLMSHVMAGLHIYYDEKLEPLDLIERLHRQIFRASRPSDFVTLFFARLDLATNLLRYVNGGHCPALLYSSDGTLTELPPTGLPLGMLLGHPYEASERVIERGELLCVYSDGIPEAFLGEEDYGEERLKESIRKRRALPLPEVAQGVLDDLRAFLGDTPPGDDITLLFLRRVG